MLGGALAIDAGWQSHRARDSGPLRRLRRRLLRCFPRPFLNLPAGDDSTALHDAVAGGGSPSLVRLLLEAGADVEQPSSPGPKD